MSEDYKMVRGGCYICDNYIECNIEGYPINIEGEVIPKREPHVILNDNEDNKSKIIICSRCCRVLRVLLDKLR